MGSSYSWLRGEEDRPGHSPNSPACQQKMSGLNLATRFQDLHIPHNAVFSLCFSSFQTSELRRCVGASYGNYTELSPYKVFSPSLGKDS